MTKPERGSVTRTAPAYDAMVVGTCDVGFPAAAVRQQQMPMLEVLLQNDPGSANDIHVGNQFGQYFVLQAGESITIKINDLSDVYVVAPAGAATLNWIAYT